MFYREDATIKQKIPQIFMTNDDQLNCRFEPCAGSLNPDFWKLGPMPEKCRDTAETDAAYRDKHGDNFKKTHPEIFKKGILKKATREFTEGTFSKANATLLTGFKLRSLR